MGPGFIIMMLIPKSRVKYESSRLTATEKTQGATFGKELQRGATITCAYYVNLIFKLRYFIRRKRRRMLHSYTFAIAKAAITDAGFKLVEHPTYLQDPTDCFVKFNIPRLHK